MDRFVVWLGGMDDRAYRHLRICLGVIIAVCVLLTGVWWWFESSADVERRLLITAERQMRRAVLMSRIEDEKQKSLHEIALYGGYSAQRLIPEQFTAADLPRTIAGLAQAADVELHEIAVDASEVREEVTLRRYRLHGQGGFAGIEDLLSRISEELFDYAVSEISLRNPSWPNFDGTIDVTIVLQHVTEATSAVDAKG